MNLPDAVTTGLTVAVVQQAAKQAQDFLAAAYGHKGESLGSILGDIAHRRRTNVDIVSSKAHLTLLDIGVKVGEIPLNVLQPALEAASLQEDPDIQTIWANLLANAADPRNLVSVEVAYPYILRELGGREVKFLDAIERASTETKSRIFAQQQLIRIYADAGLAKLDDLTVFEPSDIPTADKGLDILHRTLGLLIKQGLLSLQTIPRPSRIDLGRISGSPMTNSTITVDVKSDEQFAFTLLGQSFVRACRKPSPTQDDASA